MGLHKTADPLIKVARTVPSPLKEQRSAASVGAKLLPVTSIGTCTSRALNGGDTADIIGGDEGSKKVTFADDSESVCDAVAAVAAAELDAASSAACKSSFTGTAAAGEGTQSLMEAVPVWL